jgi:hypothetical protein
VANQGDVPAAIWAAQAQSCAEVVIKQLSGVDSLNADAMRFLAALQPQAVAEGEAAVLARTDNLFLHPIDAPQVRIKLGSIHSVKGETHTATLVLDSFFHSHHLSELKPWVLGTKYGGSITNKKGKPVWEGARMLGRLKLHYVAMTRPTHLLCLAMRKDAFGEGELDILAGRGWTIVDCCDPAEA